jgi:Abnormal spindle-like microcephaly-assoc'd, ASPM-SPD-2-Hydin
LIRKDNASEAHTMLRKRFVFVLLTAILAIFESSKCWAKLINVPGDQPTIQAGINAASDGDTVEVAQGTYFENINFNRKLIIVTSTGGPKVTTIDGGQIGPVVIFLGDENTGAVLSGFTITDGFASSSGVITDTGGGIFISSSSPTISGNIITKNAACVGGGIEVYFGSPVIKNNTISDNIQKGCVGGGGGGIDVEGGSPKILSNLITNNSLNEAGTGGGINMMFDGSPVVQNNIISSNSIEAGSGEGGGVFIAGPSVTMIQNLIINNSAGQGGGIFLGSSPTIFGTIFGDNTIAANQASLSEGSAVYASEVSPSVILVNNLLIGSAGQNAVFCDSGIVSTTAPTFKNNDAFSQGGTGLQGSCAAQSGVAGNISDAPTFASPSLDDFRLLAGSPGIDVGLNSAPDLSTTDLDGLPRIVDGTGIKRSIIDMGAYEFQPVTAAPTNIAFGVVLLGNHVSRDVVVTNHQTSDLSISGITAGSDFSFSSSCPASLAPGASCTVSVTYAPSAVGPSNATLTVNDDDPNGPRKVALSGIGDAPGTPVILSIPNAILAGSMFSISGLGFTRVHK